MFAPRSRRPAAVRSCLCAVLSSTALILVASGSARAQDSEEAIDIDALPETGAEGEEAEAGSEERADAEESGSDEAGAPAPEEASSELPALLAWYGSLESDLGYAHYEAEDEAQTDDSLQDHRGRFVVAPLLHLELGDFFFEATGQLVAWVKNNEGLPLIAADDVWGKFGKQDVWDIQFGRFEAWRVYQKFPLRYHNLGPAFHSRGIGESTGAFDLFTLEDTGALVSPPVSSRLYYPDIYEVSYILLREEAGSVAFHYFPSKTWGAELHAKYGEQAQQNKYGVRLAVIGRPFPFLQLSAAGEGRTSRTGSPRRSADPANPGEYTECTNCGRLDQLGFGGGAVLSLGPVELSANIGVGKETGYDTVDGSDDPQAELEIRSFGGYAQLTLGSTAIGGALNNTQRLDKADNFQTHLQTAGYIFQPLSKDLSVKLVVTYATGKDDPATQRNDDIPPLENSFYGARVRLKYYFNTL